MISLPRTLSSAAVKLMWPTNGYCSPIARHRQIGRGLSSPSGDAQVIGRIRSATDMTRVLMPHPGPETGERNSRWFCTHTTRSE